MVKRNPQAANGGGNEAGGSAGAGPSTSGGGGAEHMLTSSLRRRPSSPTLERSQHQRDVAKQAALAKIIGNQIQMSNITCRLFCFYLMLNFSYRPSFYFIFIK